MIARFCLRPATREDIPAIRALIEASVLGLAQPDYTPAQIEGSLGQALGIDAQLVDDQAYFLAFPADDPQRLAGAGGWSYRGTLCGGDTLPNRDLELLDASTDAAKIRAIYVHPAFARQGLGTLILAHCEQAAVNAGFRHFEMGSTLTGVRLYALRGYQALERVDIDLPNGDRLPVVRMVKSVAEGKRSYTREDGAPVARASRA